MAVVNIEFLSREPIENVVTELKFQIDKTVCLGDAETVAAERDRTETFLTRYCGVREVEFRTVATGDLPAVVRELRSVLTAERAAGHQVTVDITGGGSLPLVACGILAREFAVSLHLFDVETGAMTEIEGNVFAGVPEAHATPEPGADPEAHAAPFTLTAGGTPRNVPVDLDMLIRMHGGRIVDRMHKRSKDIDLSAERADIEALWSVSKEHLESWNSFAVYLQGFPPDGGLRVAIPPEASRAKLANLKKLDGKREIDIMLNCCADVGVIEDLVIETGGATSFRYRDATAKNWLWEAGCILELHTYVGEAEDSDDCLVGAHLDWDGVLHSGRSEDVLNEIDVLVLRGLVPTFISCKSGSVDKDALYELRTVTERFGGKYAKMVLAAPKGVSRADRMRAEEMGIEVRVEPREPKI
ncbi:MAG: hypothetical protein IIY92_02430 [Lachnospiraceae bacterium]|nr:hypothetical protein [Lachnospiraceae bacterium]